MDLVDTASGRWSDPLGVRADVFDLKGKSIGATAKAQSFALVCWPANLQERTSALLVKTEYVNKR